MSNLDKDAFIRCHEAIHVVCSSAVPCIQDVIQTWHSQQQQAIGVCTNPQQCPTSGKPKPPKSCRVCSGWGSALETVEYTDQAQAIQKIHSSIAWTNINPTQLFQDPVEVAKAFGIRFPKGQQHPTTFDEFDTASLLLMMMKFGEFHRQDWDSYLIIKKVSVLRNSLSHMKVTDKLHIDDATLTSNFHDMNNLIDCLQRLHPNHFTATLVPNMKSQLHDIRVQAVTSEMEERALKPLTAEMKQWMQQLVEESNKELKSSVQGTVLDATKTQTKQLQDTVRGQTKQQIATIGSQIRNVHTNMEAKARERHEQQQQEIQTMMEAYNRTMQETIQASLQPMIRSMETNFVMFQQTPHIQQQVQATAVEGLHTKMEALNKNEKKTIQDLGLPVEQDYDVEKPVTKALLTYEGNTLPAASSHDRAGTSHDLAGTSHDPAGPSHDPAVTTHDPDQTRRVQSVTEDTLAEIATWRDRLIRKYILDRWIIKFGRNRWDKEDTEYIFVDLTLLANEKEIKLASYDELFTLQMSKEVKRPANHGTGVTINHILLQGLAGSGKTTLLSRLAYLWANSKCVSQGGSFSASDHGEFLSNRFQLVFVLELRKLDHRESLEMTIQRQLLPDIPLERLARVLSMLGTQCMIFLDGFDEIPKDLRAHALESPLLSECCVIVATRPHLVDEFFQNHDSSKYAHVRISGFSSENSEKYIHKFFNHSELGCALVEKIRKIPFLQASASSPVLLSIICLLWKDSPSDETQFNSITMLYETAVKYLRKHFVKNNQLSSEVMENTLLKVGKPALEAIFNNTLHIESSSFDQDILQQSFDIGLTILEKGALVGDTYVTFVHKTFQEYCAAKYLAHLFESCEPAFHSTLHKLNKDNVRDMEYVFQFCCEMSTGAAQDILHYVVNLWPTQVILHHVLNLCRK